jgi:NAD(P)-dependent dehydrogenase (short-subunit alcohol dehydrogenase family)
MANVLITGTSKGIGLETALALGRAGHRVFATMRNLGRGGTLRAAVEKEKLPVLLT